MNHLDDTMAILSVIGVQGNYYAVFPTLDRRLGMQVFC